MLRLDEIQVAFRRTRASIGVERGASVRRGVTSHLEEGETQLVTRLYPGLRAFASVVAPADEDPNDLVQEAFVRTLRGGSLSRLEYPKAYLRTAIYHLAVSARRRWATALEVRGSRRPGLTPHSGG